MSTFLSNRPAAREAGPELLVLAKWEEYLPRFKKVSPLPHVAPPPPREQQMARRDALLAASRARAKV